MYKTLIVEQAGEVMTVSLNRTRLLNALNTELMLEMKDLLAKLRCDLKTRFVIFTGAGKAFSSGVDFSRASMEARYSNPELPNERIWQCFGHDFMRAMENLEQITVAAVNGAAIGGGLCLAMNCDFRIGAASSVYGIPEANLGIFYTWGATPRLTALIGPAKAKELIMTCDAIDAQEAWRIGLINKVVPDARLMDSCRELVAKLATKGPLALRICKKQVNVASLARVSDLYPLEPEVVEAIMRSGQAEEGARAFMEKRPPVFKDTTPSINLEA
jgi:enoyl-CoA hydratase/carnithine racemase